MKIPPTPEMQKAVAKAYGEKAQLAVVEQDCSLDVSVTVHGKGCYVTDDFYNLISRLYIDEKNKLSCSSLVRPTAKKSSFLPLFSKQPPPSNFEQRCIKMSQYGTYAELPEVCAAAYCFNLEIKIYVAANPGFHPVFEIKPQKKALARVRLLLENHHYQVLLENNSIQNVKGDGNCFFHCLAYISNLTHEQVRAEVVDWEHKNPNFVIPYSNDMTILKFANFNHPHG